MSKPADRDGLGPASLETGEPADGGVASRACVWVVDDSRVQGEVVRRALTPRCEVVVFDGGSAVLERMAAGKRPDALVLDWHMPDLSGLEVCQFVRRTLNVAELPILVLTASGASDHLLQALAAGANDFVKKPFSEPELQARVSSLVSMRSLHGRVTETERQLRIEAEFRERFMGMLAHDLRQPLNTISMAGHALTRPGATADQSLPYVGLQLKAAGRMERMIAELLDFTRARPESGMPIQKQRVDLASIVRATVDEMQLSHPEHALTLAVEGTCLGDWDPDRLAQVCSNLIGNAFEHGSAGCCVEVRLASDGERVQLRVSNEGPLIPADLLASLFEPFRRSRGAARPSSGLGLGLHIVEQIVRAHSGSISVTSEQGTTSFVVTLPCGDGGATSSESGPRP